MLCLLGGSDLGLVSGRSGGVGEVSQGQPSRDEARPPAEKGSTHHDLSLLIRLMYVSTYSLCACASPVFARSSAVCCEVGSSDRCRSDILPAAASLAGGANDDDERNHGTLLVRVRYVTYEIQLRMGARTCTSTRAAGSAARACSSSLPWSARQRNEHQTEKQSRRHLALTIPLAVLCSNPQHTPIVHHARKGR